MSLAAFTIDKLTGTDLSTIHSGVDDNIVCFANIDDDVRPASLGSYPIAVPQISGQANYSFENCIRLRCITAPNNTVSGLRVYGSMSSPGDGLTILMGVTSGVLTPNTNVSTIATGIQHTQYYDSDTAYLDWPISGANAISSVGGCTQTLVTQLKVEIAASGNTGNMKLSTLHIKYYES